MLTCATRNVKPFMKTLCMQMLNLPGLGNKAELSELENAICREAFEVIGGSLFGARRRRRPPNWSVDLWMNEMEQVALEAALEAKRDHGANPEVELAAFVYQRVRSKLRDYCSKEWGFGWRTARDGL